MKGCDFMRVAGICKLEAVSYAYGPVHELAEKVTTRFIMPGSISLKLDGEPLRYTQVDAHGNPQIGGIAHSMAIWKIRQMVRDGKIESQYDALVKYAYETTSTPLQYVTSDRLPKPEICPVCGEPIAAADLNGFDEVREVIGDLVAVSYEPRVDTICRGSVVAHTPCAKAYLRAQMIDEIAETVNLAFNYWGIDEENRFHWGKGPHDMWYELIPNEYCSRSCCAHRPWFLFHTPIGDIKVGWRKRVISITFMANFADFDMDIFHDEDVTKYVENGERTIHAWGEKKLFDYMNRVQKAVLPNKPKPKSSEKKSQTNGKRKAKPYQQVFMARRKRRP